MEAKNEKADKQQLQDQWRVEKNHTALVQM